MRIEGSQKTLGGSKLWESMYEDRSFPVHRPESISSVAWQNKKTCFRCRHGPLPWPLSNRPFLLFKADFPTIVQIWPGLVLKSLLSEQALLEEIIRGLPLERAMLILFNAEAIKSPLALNEAQIER